MARLLVTGLSAFITEIDWKWGLVIALAAVAVSATFVAGQILVGFLARRSRAQPMGQGKLLGHTVDERMRPIGTVVGPELPLSILMHDYFAAPHARSILVVVDDDLLGEVSFDNATSVAPADWAGRTVADVMSPRASVATTDAREPLAFAFARLTRRDVDQLPVVDGNRILGVLHLSDLIPS